MIPESPTTLDRLWTAFRALVRESLPALTYLGPYEYRVTATDGTGSSPANTVDCSPTDAALKLPSLAGVPLRLPYGVTPPVGALCTVQFMNGDPSRPMVTNFSDPMTLIVFAAGKLPNARQGDMVACSISPLNAVQLASCFLCATPGSPPVATPAIIAAAAIPGAPMPVPPGPITVYGLVSSGNPQVKS